MKHCESHSCKHPDWYHRKINGRDFCLACSHFCFGRPTAMHISVDEWYALLNDPKTMVAA